MQPRMQEKTVSEPFANLFPSNIKKKNRVDTLLLWCYLFADSCYGDLEL